MANDLDVVANIIEAENLVLPKFNGGDKNREKEDTGYWARGKRNTEFNAGEHWTPEQKAKFIKQGRIPFTMDKTSHAINTILGSQRESRTEVQFLERSSDDGPRVDTLNAVWKYYEDANEFIYSETDVFTDGVVALCGVFGCEIIKRNGLPFLQVGRIPYDTVLWDLNFRQYDLSDAQWMSQRLFYRREALAKMYPDQKKLIMLAGMDKDAEPKARPFAYDTWVSPDKELISVRRFYERNIKTKWLIWKRESEIPEETSFATKREAEKEVRNRLAFYEVVASEMQAKNLQALPRPEYEIVPADFPIVNRTVVVVNGVLEETQELPLGDFPLTMFFSYFHDGRFWTAVDRLRDPQIFMNRMMAHADHAIGTSAKGVLRMSKRLPRNDRKAIQEAWGKTGGAFTAEQGQLEVFEGRGPQPQLFSMMDRAEGIMDDTFGGANNLGFKQTASESGRAVLARQQQAGLDNFVPLDNMRRTKQLLGKKLAYYLTNDIPQAQKLRIQGHPMQLQGMAEKGVATMSEKNPTVAYADVNTKDANTITGLEVDVIVGEAAYSPSKMQATVAAMVDMFKAIPGLPPPPIDVVIDSSPLPEELKTRWKANVSPPEPKDKVSTNFKDMPLDAKIQHLERLGFTVNKEQAAMKEVSENPLVQQDLKGKVAQTTQAQKAMLTPKEQAGEA